MEEKKEKIFVDGMRYSKPMAGSPEFVKGNFGVKVVDNIVFMMQNTDGIDVNNPAVLKCVQYLRSVADTKWINYKFLKSKNNNLYLELNTWKPNPSHKKAIDDAINGFDNPEEDIKPEEIPF